MSDFTDQIAATLLYTAASSPRGIVIRSDDLPRARQVLWQRRKDLADPLLQNLHIRISPDSPDNEIWLLNLSEPWADATADATTPPTNEGE